MGRTCIQCGRINPSEARYCFFDGVIMVNQAGLSGPLVMGKQAFSTPFVFPSGRTVHNIDQLALACQEDGLNAWATLQNGDLANFLSGVGRADLAREARIAAASPNRGRGLDGFLGVLPTTVLHPPQLSVEPTEVDLGSLLPGQNVKHELRLCNTGMRLLWGTITCVEGAWLSLGGQAPSARKVFQFAREMILPLEVQGQALAAGFKPLVALVEIESNGGSATVVVKATVAVKPFPDGVLAGAQNPRQLAEKAKAQPREAAAFFEKGAVAQWYRANGWVYPVQGPATSGLGSIQQFFEALGLAQAPRVEVSATQVHLLGKPGEQLRQLLEVRTQENRSVFAVARSNQPWLLAESTPTQGRSAPVWLIVNPVPDRPGETLQAQVTITSNGGQRFVIPVNLAIAAEERPAVVPRPTALPVEALRVKTGPCLPEPATPTPVPATPIPSPSAGERRGRAQPTWPWHLLPFGLLALIMLTMFLRDVFHTSTGPGDQDPRLALRFHTDPDDKISVATMNFGLELPQQKDPKDPANLKRLTFDPWGRTNNLCIRLDGQEFLFGYPPGSWQEKKGPLGKESRGQERDGARSVWDCDHKHVLVTQTVEIVPGQVSRLLDTCLVRYRIDNRDRQNHTVGLRFMLDTYIGANDGVPFTLPGSKDLCNTQKEFNTPEEVPDFIQALEYEDLQNPGTVAHVQLRLGGSLVPPQRVTLGAWPNPVLNQLRVPDQRLLSNRTGWEVPVLSLKLLDDSAVVVYWPTWNLKPGESREMGFTYGLGGVASQESGGKLGLTVGGALVAGADFTVTAYVSRPIPGQRLTLSVPPGLRLVHDDAVQNVPPVQDIFGGSHNSIVSWKVRADRSGNYLLVVESSTGLRQTLRVEIKGPMVD